MLPVAFGPKGESAVVLLTGDEDGLRCRAADAPGGLCGAWFASIELDGVYFREDETLADESAAFIAAVRPAVLALRRGLAFSSCARHPSCQSGSAGRVA